MSSRNATVHGMRSGELVLPDEDPAEFEERRRSLLAYLMPKGELEVLLADRIVSLAWRLRRPARAEAATIGREAWSAEEKLASAEMDRHVRHVYGDDMVLPAGLSGLDALTKPVVVDEDAHRLAKEKRNRAVNKVLEADKVAAVFRGDAAASLELLQRYETNLERSLFRCVGELRKLQAARKGS